MAAHQSFARAQGVHRLITVNTRVRGDLLAEDGLRATVLSRELDAFNKDVLKPLALASGFSPVTGEAVGGQGWPDVTIEKNFDVRWGLYRYDLASTSQQWRARAIIQIALAQIKKDVVVVLDEVSATLTPGTLSGLFSLLQFAGVTAVMGWKETKIKRLPPLKAKGLGRVYFVENGKCKEIEWKCHTLERHLIMVPSGNLLIAVILNSHGTLANEWRPNGEEPYLGEYRADLLHCRA